MPNNITFTVPAGASFKLILGDGTVVMSEGFVESAAMLGQQEVGEDEYDADAASLYGDELDDGEEFMVPVMPKKGCTATEVSLGRHLVAHPLLVVREAIDYLRTDWDAEHVRLKKYHMACHGIYLAYDGWEDVGSPVLKRYALSDRHDSNQSVYVDLKRAAEMEKRTLSDFLKKYKINNTHFHGYLRHYKQTNRL
jgi:hypothetical protein